MVKEHGTGHRIPSFRRFLTEITQKHAIVRANMIAI